MTYLRKIGSSLTVQALALVAYLVWTPWYFLRGHAAVLDPDIWWHMRVGDWILENRALPHTGIYSQLAGHKPWIAYSWLFEVAVSRLYHWFGIVALPVSLVCLQASIAFVLFWTLRRVANGFWRAWMIAVVAMFAFRETVPLRPSSFTILFFIVELALILEARRTGNVRWLYWLPPLMLLWANIHIQFVYGVFVFGLFTLDAFLRSIGASRNWRWTRDQEARELPSQTVEIVMVAVLVATCIGPYFIHIYGVIFGYARNTMQYDTIIELAAMTFRAPAHFVELFMVAAVFFLKGWRRRVDFFGIMLLLSCAAVSFRSTRDAWFLCVAAALMAAEALRSEMEQKKKEAAWQRWIPAAALVAGIAICIGAGSRALKTQSLFDAIDAEYPIRATEYVREHHLQGPMYNTFNWGGFLIFNLRGYPVSIDGRTDLYGSAYTSEAFLTVNGRDWNSDATLARANFVLLEKTLPLASVLAADPQFQLVYADQIAAVFVRKR